MPATTTLDPPTPQASALVLGLPTACSALGIGKSCGYDAARRGAFPARVIRVGARYRVVTATLIPLLSGEDDAA